MNVFERHDLHLLNDRLRATQDENLRLRRRAEINRTVTWGCVVAIGVVLVVKFYGGSIWTALLSLIS